MQTTIHTAVVMHYVCSFLCPTSAALLLFVWTSFTDCLRATVALKTSFHSWDQQTYPSNSCLVCFSLMSSYRFLAKWKTIFCACEMCWWTANIMKKQLFIAPHLYQNQSQAYVFLVTVICPSPGRLKAKWRKNNFNCSSWVLLNN